MCLPEAVEVCLDKRCYVIKKKGIVTGEASGEEKLMKVKQITWSMFGGAGHAWEFTKYNAKFV